MQIKIPLLCYLLDFLDSYDFGSGEEYEAHALIGASVLGNVFERLNAYKEGSFYTPSAITNYMCEQSITRVVVDKFNATFAWQCEDLNALRTRIDRDFDTKKQEFKDTLKSIRICDPAVGSGHFLVAALNKMLKIYYDLGLCGNIQREEAHIIGDEFYLSDFSYFKPKRETEPSHKIQKELFALKKSIIENNLFGVDINPNSVEICKLRLWIELLKSSYYLLQGDKGYDDKLDSHIHQMQTLPNIDINIKCGNSLISNFPLDSKLNKGQTPQFSKKLAQAITKYKTQVALYKESLGSKDEIEREIKSIKNLLKDYFIKQSQTTKNLESNLQKFVENYGETFFDCGDDFCMEMVKIIKAKQNERKDKGGYAYRQPLTTPSHSSPKALDKCGEKLLKQLQSDFKSLESLRNNNLFEWRFEFPEVLNAEGDFMGFDLIIGNPPYIKEADNKRLFENTKNLRTYQGKMDIWYHFVGKGFDLVKNQSIVTFIATNNWTTNAGAQKLRNVILSESQILNLVDFGSYMCFDSASIQTMIMEFRKTKSIPKSYTINYSKIEAKNPTDKHRDAVLKRENFKDNIYLSPIITPNKLIDNNIAFTRNFQQNNLLNKIAECSNFNFTQKEIGQGICPSLDNLFILKDISSFSTKETKYIKEWHTGLPQKYYVLPTNKFLIYMSAKNYKKDNLDDLPNLKKHFEPYKDKLTKAKIQYKTPNKPYFFLHREREERFFIKGNEKIISQVRCEIPTFAYSQENFYGSRALFFLQTNRISMKYLLGVLNSTLIAFWLKYKGKIQGNLYKIEKDSLLNIPIVEPNAKNQKIADKIVNLVDKVLETKAQGKDSTTPLCHTEALAEVSQKQKRDLVDSSLSAKAQNDKRRDRDISRSAQNDKTIKDCNDTNNHNKDISHTAQYDKTNKSQYDNTTDLESQIDKLVYQLYDLTHDEIKIIESN